MFSIEEIYIHDSQNKMWMSDHKRIGVLWVYQTAANNENQEKCLSIL